jgi:hypothetical protein
MIDLPQVVATVGALSLIVAGARGLQRGEIRRKRQWGEFGGPKELPPIRGGTAIAYCVWLLVAGAAILAWTWTR